MRGAILYRGLVKLDGALKQRIRAVVGRPAPDARQGDAFDLFLDDLARRDVALYRETVEALYGQGATPAEAQAARIARRERLQTWLARLFYHPNARGVLVVDKRKTGLLVGLALASSMAVVYVLATRLPVGAPPEAARGAAGTRQVPEPRLAATLATEAEEPSRRTAPNLPAPHRVQPTLPLAVARPPRTTPPSLGSPLPSSLPAATGLGTEVDPALPTEMSLLNEATTPEPSSMSLTVRVDGLSALPAPEGRASAEGLSAGAAVAALPARMGLEDETKSQEDASLTLEAAAVEPGKVASMSLPAASDESLALPGSPQGEGKAAWPGQKTDGFALQPRAPTSAPVAASLAPLARPSTLPPGTRLPATLTTAVALLQGGTAPVVAKTEGGWCGEPGCPVITWVGEASLIQPNRVGLTFTQAVVGDVREQASAAAFGPDGLPGVPATVRDATPTLAQDLVRGAAGGVTRYVDALAARQTLTESGERAVIEGAPPSLETFLLGGVSDLFDLPDEPTAVVRVAEVPAGTPVALLYGVARGR